jgi:DNA-directed RNA polymerase specialized sigma subunit
MASSKSRRLRACDLLPSIFRQPLPPVDETIKLWQQYQDTGAESDFQTIIERFAPLVFFVAHRLKLQNPDLFTGDFEDLIGDGMLALAAFVRRIAHKNAAIFLHAVRTHVRDRIYRAQLLRRGISTEQRTKYPAGFFVAARAAFVRQHGRMPSKPELAAMLAETIDNPGMQFGERPSIHSHSDLSDASQMANEPSAHDDAPDKAAINREMMKLASKKLHGDDLKVFKLAIAGWPVEKIAAKLNRNVAGVHKRINGVFWTVRANAELASYLGVEPVKELPRGERGDWPSIRKLAPARKIA